MINVTVTPTPPDQVVPYEIKVKPGSNYRMSYLVPADRQVTLEVQGGEVTLTIDAPPATPPAQ